MCGIIGIINNKNAKSLAKHGLERISYRGKDDIGFYHKDGMCFGHCLHAVVSKVKQPLQKDGFVFGTNCEIYNWKDLNKRYNFNAKNDAELFFDLLIHHLKNQSITEQKINEVLAELDGVFSFFFYDKSKGYTVLARDVLGVKPLWFSYDNKSFSFASESKAIETKTTIPQELNPRNIIIYDHKKNKSTYFHQPFFNLSTSNKPVSKTTIKTTLIQAIKKRIPTKKVGVLFSGGLDSTVIAWLLKKHGKDFTAYMTTTKDKKETIENAKHISKKIGFKLTITTVTKDQIKTTLPKIINLIESCDPVKVEVATTLYFSLKVAKKDNVKVMFSGIGADDLFGGYKRMRMYHNLNEDTISNLRRLYERDLYRDDVLSMYHQTELRLPFLDKELITKVLQIPSSKKQTKIPKGLLRSIANLTGLPNEFTKMKRQAAQYSSGISKVIKQLAKEQDYKSKAKYFQSLYKKKNIKLGVLCSSGKDSLFALHIMDRLQYDISCLITIESQNKDSYMFHTPSINAVKYQAKALSVPLVWQTTHGKKEAELQDLKKAIKKAKKKYNIQGIVSGALYSNYQRTRIERIADELNLKVFAPLWHTDQESYMKRLPKEGFKVIITHVASDGLDKSWLGKVLTKESIEELLTLAKKYKFNPSFEGGEAETLVLNCPLFKKELKITKTTKENVTKHSGQLKIQKIALQKKN